MFGRARCRPGQGSRGVSHAAREIATTHLEASAAYRDVGTLDRVGPLFGQAFEFVQRVGLRVSARTPGGNCFEHTLHREAARQVSGIRQRKDAFGETRCDVDGEAVQCIERSVAPVFGCEARLFGSRVVFGDVCRDVARSVGAAALEQPFGNRKMPCEPLAL